MGTVPDWVRANHKKNGYADGGEVKDEVDLDLARAYDELEEDTDDEE